MSFKQSLILIIGRNLAFGTFGRMPLGYYLIIISISSTLMHSSLEMTLLPPLGFYISKQSAITRASDDYYPKKPTTQSLHIAAVAFNHIFLGEIVVPDWDMFYVCYGVLTILSNV